MKRFLIRHISTPQFDDGLNAQYVQILELDVMNDYFSLRLELPTLNRDWLSKKILREF